MSDAMTDVAALVAKVDQLQSRLDIIDLAANYCHGFDKRDFERFLSIWWEDCVWDIGPPFGRFVGHEGIREAIYDVLWPAWDESHHLTTNNIISFSTADAARAVCDVDCVGRLAGESVCQIVGATYTDDLERRNGIWRIKQRSVQIHYFNPVSGTQLVAPAA